MALLLHVLVVGRALQELLKIFNNTTIFNSAK